MNNRLDKSEISFLKNNYLRPNLQECLEVIYK